MTNIFDYLHWRGDLSFRTHKFNIIDSMILARFSYLPFDNIVTDKPISLKSACMQFLNANRQTRQDVIMPEDIDLLKILMQTKRFKRLKLQHYENIIDVQKELQFSAMIIHLDKYTSYIAFRGTDLTLVGWKEDFNMIFKQEIPSQKMAIHYLEKYADSLHHRIILGGHSKGGNLAIYAAIFCDPTIQTKIISIHNFDGPGFNQDIITNENYLTISSKIQTFIPETAIIGRLLNHDTVYNVVKSDQNYLKQHDTYSWTVDVDNFVYVDQTDEQSQQIHYAVETLIQSMTPSQLQDIIDNVYQLLVDANITDLRDFTTQIPSKVYKILSSIGQLDKQTIKLISKSIQTLFKAYTMKQKQND